MVFFQGLSVSDQIEPPSPSGSHRFPANHRNRTVFTGACLKLQLLISAQTVFFFFSISH